MKNKTHHKNNDCLECKYVPCLNLFCETNDTDKRGEIFFLKNNIKDKKVVPCEFSVLIYSLCQLIAKIFDKETISCRIFYQSIKDLRTAAFLILTGHYRNSL